VSVTEPALAADTALEPIGEHRWRGEVSKRWWIISGPYGGYISAMLVRALELAVDDAERPPRSFTVHFLAPPAEGPVEIAATIERTGGSATAVSLRMEQEGTTLAVAVAAAGRWRDDTPEWMELEMPAVEAPEAYPEIPEAQMLPPFVGNYELRWVAGGAPGHPGKRARNLSWVRLRPGAPLDHLAVTSLSDTLVPAAMSLLGRVLVVPTLDLTIHFRAPLPVDDEWALVSFRSGRSAGGVWEEDGEVWSRSGRLLAQSRQLALIREPR
jgi:acyl-CoA thioesterase